MEEDPDDEEEMMGEGEDEEGEEAMAGEEMYEADPEQLELYNHVFQMRQQ